MHQVARRPHRRRCRGAEDGHARTTWRSRRRRPSDQPAPQEENRDRFVDFKTNPDQVGADDPVSTFSIDVDTASYSFVRRSLKEGYLPQPTRCASRR